ncbi:MAG: SAM-dependent methyltransferase [Streptosporangiaceae bacterium]
MKTPGFDPQRPNPARMYDYYLGGKDHFACDREAAERILELAPETRDLVRENRGFLGRAVEFLVDAGVRQFLDVGAGIPAQDSVHEIVARTAPESRVVYVDSDPVACAHAQALIDGDVLVLEADMRDPARIIAEAAKVLDFTRPVGLILAAVLHFIPDDAEAKAIMTGFREAIVPGSWLILSHGTAGGISAQTAKEGTLVYQKSSNPTRLRSREEISGFFEGFEQVEPGLVNVASWRCIQTARAGAHMLGAVARRA